MAKRPKPCSLGRPRCCCLGMWRPVCPACRWGDIQEAPLDGSHTASAEAGLSRCPGHMLCQSLTALLVLEAFSDLELPPWAYHSRPGCTPAPATQEGWHVQRAGWYKSTNNGDTLPSQDPWPQNKNTSAGTPRKLVRCFCSSCRKRVAQAFWKGPKRALVCLSSVQAPGVGISGGLRGSGGHPHHLL